MLVITGLMRSGTSMVAAMAHHLGVYMGRRMEFPAPGTDPEYEDTRPAAALSELALGLSRRAARVTYWERLGEHMAAEARARGLDRWGVKSPLFLLTDTWRRAWPRAQVIVCERPVADCEGSIRRVKTPHTDRLVEIQRRLEAVPTGQWKALRFPYDEVRKSPEWYAKRIDMLVGRDAQGKDYRAVTRHVRRW